jgi:D-alanyl-D-alanine carboxypeptidase
MRNWFGGVVSRSAMSVRSLLVAGMVASTLIVGAGHAYALTSAAIVVDAKTGKILYSRSPDAQCYPASLTKMMTLYLLFDALAGGKTTLNSRISMSAHAAAQAPSKLGLKPGESLTVRDAILAIVTRSANDVAVAIAEYLGGSEGAFAAKMTSTARAIGMTHTSFRNASGLPNPGQLTTARDMATLGRALQDRFPGYFGYFSTASFVFQGHRIANHNHLLGRVPGVNGIKTGYTRASGYNLVTSVDRGNRKVVAVVLGGTSGRARDLHMASMIEDYLPAASTGTRTAGLVGVTKPVAEASAADAIPAPHQKPDPAETASIVAANAADPVDDSQGDGGGDDTPQAADPMPVAAAPMVSAPMVAKGWKIQLGATPNQSQASALLDRARSKAKTVLASAAPYTQPVTKGSTTLYRARFAGFQSKESARAACAYLAKQDFTCLALSD